MFEIAWARSSSQEGGIYGLTFQKAFGRQHYVVIFEDFASPWDLGLNYGFALF